VTRALALEDFTAGSGPPPMRPPAPEGAAQEAALAAYEDGYRNGWDDCARAEAESRHHVGADLAAALREMTMTHAEARAEVLASLGPLFEEIAGSLLPALAAAAVAPAVVAELRAAAAAGAAGRAVLIAAPGALPALERLLPAAPDLEVELRGEPAYAEGQVSLRFGAERRDIDLGEAADRMAAAIRAFVAQDTGPARPAVPIRKGAA
jgi:flagellar assembly protein FliH